MGDGGRGSRIQREPHSIAVAPLVDGGGTWLIEVLTLIPPHGGRSGTRYVAQATHIPSGATCGWAEDDLADRTYGQKHAAKKHALRLHHMCARTRVDLLPPRHEME